MDESGTPGSGQSPDGTPGRRAHFSARSLLSPSSYRMSLFVIATTYLMSVYVRPRWTPLVTILQIVAVLLILRASRVARPARVGLTVLLFVGGAVALAQMTVQRFTDVSALAITVQLLSAALYFVAPVAVLRHVVTRDRVDTESLLGAIAAYLLIGMFFAFAYRAVATIQPTPFYGANGDGTTADHLFFSFITMATVGYGNLVPAYNPGQTLAVCEAITGQVFLITALAKIVNAWNPARDRATRISIPSQTSDARSDA